MTIGRLELHVATDRLTATRQLSCLPTCPQYCRATPTECLPFFGKPVSSTIQATTGPCFSTRAIHNYALAPAAHHRSRAPWPPNGVRTGASAGRCPGPDAPPSVRHSCVPPVQQQSFAVVLQRRLPIFRAPRLSPGHPYMPRSASPVGLARKGVIPQNKFTSKCSFMTQ